MSENQELVTTNDEGLVISSPLPLDQQPAAVYLAGLGNEKARRVQLDALRRIARILTNQDNPLVVDWAAVRFQHAQAVRSRLMVDYSPASCNRILAALRGTLKAAFLLDQMTAGDYQKAIMVENVTGETLPAGRELSPGEIGALMQSCENDPTPAGARDAAIIAILYSCGLRRAELAELTMEDYNQEGGALRVMGKRGKEREVYPVNGAGRALADWLAIRGAGPGALFVPITKGGKLTTRRMTTQAVYNMLVKRGAEAKINGFSPHDLRRTFVSDLLAAGADLSTVARMAGHANVTTTARYDRRPREAQQKAAGLLHVPYKGRLV